MLLIKFSLVKLFSLKPDDYVMPARYHIKKLISVKLCKKSSNYIAIGANGLKHVIYDYSGRFIDFF